MPNQKTRSMKSFKFILLFLLIIFCSCAQNNKKETEKILDKNQFIGIWVLYSVNDTLVTPENYPVYPSGFIVDEKYTTDFYRYSFHLEDENILTLGNLKSEWNIYNNTLYFDAGWKPLTNWIACTIYNKLTTRQHVSRLVRYADAKSKLINIENNIMTVEYTFKKNPNYGDMRYKVQYIKKDMNGYLFI